MSDDDDFEFRINRDYAKSYDKWRRKEEIQKLKDRYGDDAVEGSSSSETEDDDAEEITPQKEKDFLIVLSNIKSRDPKIYKQDVHFFQPEPEENEDDTNIKEKKKKKEKPMFLKDYERQIIIEKEGKFTDDEEEEWTDRPASPTYTQEQENIKKSFETALKDNDSDAEENLMFIKKEKSKKEKHEEEREYVKWLKEQPDGESERTDTTDKQELSALRKIWTDPELEESEQFLRDYILNKGYVHKGDGTDVVNLSEDEDFSEEERLLEQQDDFERKYNFRFEEPDQEFIKRYPRTVGSSLRRKDTSRAEKRIERKTRKDEEKQKKVEELKQLKNLKKQEIMDQLEKLKLITGNATVGFDVRDLEGDFDPDKHDQLMQKIFSEEYEDLEEEKSKPGIDFEDEDLNVENWDDWGEDWQTPGQTFEEEGPHCDDPNFVMDADYDPRLHQTKKDKKKKQGKDEKQAIPEVTDEEEEIGKRRSKKQSRFAEMLKQEKPVFDPANKTFEEYLEDYYKLDYEDLIGDLPCRFKYRTVVPNDFGLSVEEILGAREHELNQWASVKKTTQYRSEAEEYSDVNSYQHKAQNSFKKKRIFQSLHRDEEDEDATEGTTHENTKPEETEEPKPEPRLSKRKMKKLKYLAERQESHKVIPDSKEGQSVPFLSEKTHLEERKDAEQKDLVPTKHKKKKMSEKVGEVVQKEISDRQTEEEVSDVDRRRERKRKVIEDLKAKKRRFAQKEQVTDGRFRAYGLNPKKQRYKMIQQKKKKRKEQNSR